MGKIYEFHLSYSITKGYMLFCFRRFYGQFIVQGRENLPKDDSPLIFAPNHLNALMDALAVSTLVPHHKAVIYLARADLFANKMLAKLMHFVKIMPAFRMRDGIDNLEKNNRIFFHCVEVLRFKHALCIMPEGGQGEQQKIRSLVKGIFRIAFNAQQKFGDTKKVKIVPVGIDFGDLEKSGKHILINIGKPIEIQDYMHNFSSNPVTTVNEIKEDLRQKLSELTVDYATTKYYNCYETVAEIIDNEYVGNTDDKKNTIKKFNIRQETAKKLVEMERENPAKMEELNRLSRNYRRYLSKLRFKSGIFSNLKRDEVNFELFLKLFVTFPVFAFGFATNVLPVLVPVWLRKALKVEYSGFFSSVQFAIGMICFPLFYIIQTLLFNIFFSPAWWVTMIFFFLQYLSRPWAYNWHSKARKFIERLRFNRLLMLNSKKSTQLYRLISVRNKIVYLFNN